MMNWTWTRWLLPADQGPRDPSIDTARALLMLYVVGYLHLGGYKRAAPISDPLLHWLWLLGMGLPLVLMLSALLQTTYDRLLQRGLPSLSKFARP